MGFGNLEAVVTVCPECHFKLSRVAATGLIYKPQYLYPLLPTQPRPAQSNRTDPK